MSQVRSRYGPRPELGELTPGQKVIVYRSPNDMRGRKPEDRTIPAVVVKAARVWMELVPADGATWPTWRMRRNTQDEATQYTGSNASFATIEQYEWDETQRWAWGYLREQGIEVRSSSAWNGREVELADIISHGTDRTEAL